MVRSGACGKDEGARDEEAPQEIKGYFLVLKQRVKAPCRTREFIAQVVHQDADMFGSSLVLAFLGSGLQLLVTLFDLRQEVEQERIVKLE